jgi:hypothetical protein
MLASVAAAILPISVLRIGFTDLTSWTFLAEQPACACSWTLKGDQCAAVPGDTPLMLQFYDKPTLDS